MQTLVGAFHSRTVWFNVLTLALGIFELVTQTYTVNPHTIFLFNGIGNLILRFVTTKPLSQR